MSECAQRESLGVTGGYEPPRRYFVKGYKPPRRYFVKGCEPPCRSFEKARSHHVGPLKRLRVTM